jgi:hypothetical protein
MPQPCRPAAAPNSEDPAKKAKTAVHGSGDGEDDGVAIVQESEEEAKGDEDKPLSTITTANMSKRAPVAEARKSRCNPF